MFYSEDKEVKNELPEDKEVKKELPEDKDPWKERINTHLVVATLIITISFAAGFTIPGGYDDDEGPNKGMAILARKTAFKAFVVADTLALICSTFAVLLHFNATFKRGTMRHNDYFNAAIFIMIAMLAMMIAFMTGLYVVLPFKGLAIGVCVMCSVSLCILMIVFDVQGLIDVQRLFVYGKNQIYPVKRKKQSETDERKKQSEEGQKQSEKEEKKKQVRGGMKQVGQGVLSILNAIPRFWD
ncbi:ankyrin repeat-containing protein NPR4-like [Lycium ferocissimum]|uniref:ankyrin repeat-containing protein NPR4-like n=1 Tax=Lycium ferocissimum TaxID=112874 RepID=UPI002814C4BA|nr:ankyrin repeat-containing protein NPR4-like [Lycium ferocissimum]